MIADVLHEIQQYQNTPYCLQEEKSIQVITTTPAPLSYSFPYSNDYMMRVFMVWFLFLQEYIWSITDKYGVDDDKWEDMLYDKSLEIESRDGTLKKAVSFPY